MNDASPIDTANSSPIPDAPAPTPRPSATDPDFSGTPAAILSGRGADGEGYDATTPSSLADFWTRHSGPQANPASTFSVVSEQPPKAEPPVGAALYSTPAPPPAPNYWTGNQTPEEKAQASAQADVDVNAAQARQDAIDRGETVFPDLPTHPAVAAAAASAAATIHNSLGSLSYSLAQEDAIERTNDAIKEATGVSLPNPAYGGFRDEAIAALQDQAKQQSWGTYLNPANPDGLFGGDRYWALVRQKQNDLWDQARADLAKNRGSGSDVARDVLDAISPTKSLSVLTNDAANSYEQAASSANQKAARYSSPFAADVASAVGGFAGSFRDPVNVAMLAVPFGGEATWGERFASPVLRWAGNTAEHAVNTAIINWGLTGLREPDLQATNRAFGRESGLVPAIKDMGDAAVFGAVAGGFFGGLRALSNLFGPNASPWIDEFVRRAKGMAPTLEMDPLVKDFTDRVHAWEKENGLEEGSTYRDANLHDWSDRGAPPPPAAPAAAPPRQPRPSGGAPTGAAEEAGAPRAIAPPLWEGKPVEGEAGTAVAKRPYPTPPEVPESVRDRPPITSITSEQVQQAMNDAATAPPREAGVQPSEQLRVFRELVAQAESPDTVGPPVPPMRAPPARDPGAFPPDTGAGAAPAPGGQAGERFIDNSYGLPAYRNMTFDPRTTETDAEEYQYKGNSNAKGVTGRLSSVVPKPENWNAMAANNAIIHERLDGRMMVGDGHQRDDLLKRIVAGSPDADVKLPGFLVREADGWTPAMVRALAAKKNIQEGVGEPLDIARILRDAPQIWDDSIPTGRADVREGRGLANLSDGAWGMVLNRAVKPEFASLVGNMAPPEAHVALMDDIVKLKPQSINEAKMLIGDALSAGTVREIDGSGGQTDWLKQMEGGEVRTLMRERMKIFGDAMKALKNDARVFATLAKEADVIEEAGNVLTDANASIADRADQLVEALDRLRSRAGPISAGLNRAAKRVKEGESIAAVTRAFIRELPALLREEGLRMADAPSPMVKPELDTPKGREEQIADLEAEFMRTQPTMFGEAPKTPDEQRQAIFEDVKQKLLDAGRPLNEAEANATLWAARYATRAARMGRGDPEAMYRNEGLIVRGGEGATAAAGDGRTLNQPATVPTFYSAAERAVTGAKQAKASPEQWLATIKNTPGVKPEEMKWLGLEDWLKGQKGAISRDDVAAYVRANSLQLEETAKGPIPFEAFTGASAREFLRRRGVDNIPADDDEAIADAVAIGEQDGFDSYPGATKFESYKLPGGENYRELLLTLPGDRTAAETARNARLEEIDDQRVNLEAKQEEMRGRMLTAGQTLAIRQKIEAKNREVMALSQRVALDSPEYAAAFDALQEEFKPLTSNDELRRAYADTERDRGNLLRQRAAIEREDFDRTSYRSPHWDEPNVVAHVRFDDRTVDGQRALHLAEVQSDWHQQGRKVGYKGAPTNIDTAPLWATAEEARLAVGARRDELIKQVSDGQYASKRDMLDAADRQSLITYEMLTRNDPELKRLEAAHEAAVRSLGDAQETNRGGGPGVPEAPFKTTWPELAIKRMIRFASENGYARLTWDTGATNAARYDLSKHIDHIIWDEKPSGRGTLIAYDKSGNEVLGKPMIKPEELPDLIGKEAADKLMSVPLSKARQRSLSNADLKVGGEGMEGFYDKMLPAMVAKLTKKFGGKVEDAEIPTHTARVIELSAGNFTVLDPETSKTAGDFATRQEAEDTLKASARDHNGLVPGHSLTITPELRDAAVDQGFPLFERAGEGGPRGSITMSDGKAEVNLFTKANASTFPHESAHLWLDEMARDAADAGAPQQVKDDFQTVLDWLGAKDAASITDKQHEQFARGFEQYLREGVAPSSALARAFEAFKAWLKAIYRSLLGLGKAIPDEIRAVMDRMIATDEEIAAMRAGTKTAVITGDPLVDRVTADPYVASAIANPIINRWNDVPYGAGPNNRLDRVVNIDKHVPTTDKIGGVKYDPARAVAVHEFTEQHVLNELTRAGVPEAHAYEIAHFVFAEPAERAWVAANVGPKAWDEYQAHWDKWLAPIDHENPQNPPADLYQKPYPHDDDHLAPEDRGSDKAFEETGYRNLPALRAEAERVLGDGSAPTASDIGRNIGEAAAQSGVEINGDAVAAAQREVEGEVGPIAPVLDALASQVELTPLGEQVLIPGVQAVTDALRAAVGAAAPLRGGNAEPPAGGLFDDTARAQRTLFQDDNGDLFDGEEIARRQAELFASAPTEDGPMTREQIAAAVVDAEKKRRLLLTAKAKDAVLRDVMSYRTPFGAPNMREAMYNLWEGFGHAGYPAARGLHEAYTGVVNSKMADVLENFRRTAISGRRINKPMMKELRKASFGEATTPEAKALYGAIDTAQEWTRMKANEFGTAIPKRKDYGMPQSHNEAAVAGAFGNRKDPRAAKAAWIAYVNPMLDWGKMFDPITGELFPANLSDARKTSILAHIWNNIITGGEFYRTPSMQRRGRGSVAAQHGEHRFLVFKDADSASRYNREFGKGDEFIQTVEHLHGMAADIALMHRFGPNPAGMVEYLKQVLDLERAKAEVGLPHMLGADVNNRNARAKVQRAQQLLDNFYSQYRGDRPASNALSLASDVARNVVTSALLGSSVIPHLASNWLIQTFARKAGGIPYAKVIPQLLRAFGPSSHAEMLRAGLDIENGMFSIGNGAHQMSRLQRAVNWTKWLPDRTVTWFGLHPLVEANKGAYFRGMMGELADVQKTPWGSLPERIKSKLQGYGLRERDWRVIQMAQPYEPAIGSAPWLRPIEVMALGDDPARASNVLDAYGRTNLAIDPARDQKEAKAIADDIAIRMWGYMHSEREIAVPSNSMRARARIYGNSERGTLPGEIRRQFGLFKSFIGSFMVSQVHSIWAEAARNKSRGAAYAAALVIGMTLGGLVSLQLKQLRAGKDMLNMNPFTARGVATWARALLTGGSFGIFGDFIASTHSSYGVGPLETLAGPIVEWPLAATEGIIDTIRELNAGTLRQPIGTTAANFGIKFARGSTPLLSTGWPVMALYNRILDQLSYFADRNAYHKFQMQKERLRRETGQGIYWEPGHMWPSRWPVIAPSH